MTSKHRSGGSALPRAAALLLALLFLFAGCAGSGGAGGAQPPAPSESGVDSGTQPPVPSQGGADGGAQPPAPSESGADGEVSDKALFGDFTAKDTEGNAVTNDIFADYDVTMVNIWATFCGYCVREMPALEELDEEYRDRGFQIVGVVVDATDQKGNVDDALLAEALDIIAQTGADYTHIVPSAEMFGKFLKGVRYLPTTVFVNSRGEAIGSAYEGAMEKEDWAKIIEEKLG